VTEEPTTGEMEHVAEAEEPRASVAPSPEEDETESGATAPEIVLPGEEGAGADRPAESGDPASGVPSPQLAAGSPVDVEELLITAESVDTETERLKAVIEAVIYITDEPLSPQQIAGALGRPIDQIKAILDQLAAEYARPDRGLTIRELAGGYKLSTKPEHHEEIRTFVKNLKPPLKLSLAALETLAVIAYKQPITAPEIMEIRGVQGAGVLKTLLDRKLIATAGRKNVVGKPILYKTTREFLVQFGLKDLSELPTLKEFEELGRLALTDSDVDSVAAPAAPATTHEPGHTPVEPPQDPESAPVDAPGEVVADAGEEEIETITLEPISQSEGPGGSEPESEQPVDKPDRNG
jgi:segregation and condensation protein B